MQCLNFGIFKFHFRNKSIMLLNQIRNISILHKLLDIPLFPQHGRVQASKEELSRIPSFEDRPWGILKLNLTRSYYMESEEQGIRNITQKLFSIQILITKNINKKQYIFSLQAKIDISFFMFFEENINFLRCYFPTL